MRNALRRILDEDWIVVLASGIALGYVTLDFARAVGGMVTMYIVRAREGGGDDTGFFGRTSGALEGQLYQLVGSAVSFAMVLGIVAFVVSLLPRKAP